jgi:hypothetical protein
LEVSGQLQATAALPTGKVPPEPVKKVKLSPYQAVEAYRIPHFLDNLLTYDGFVVSLTHPQENLLVLISIRG